MACTVPRHYLNHSRLIVKCALRNKLQWNFNRNSILFIKEYAFEIFTAEFSIGRFVNKFNIKTDLIRSICDAGQVLMTFSLGHRTNSQCNRVWHNTLLHYAASRWLCYLYYFIAIPTSQGVSINIIEISHLLLIASTECAQYRFCRRILPSAVGALVVFCFGNIFVETTYFAIFGSSNIPWSHGEHQQCIIWFPNIIYVVERQLNITPLYKSLCLVYTTLLGFFKLGWIS